MKTIIPKTNQLVDEAAQHYKRTGVFIKPAAKTATLERLNTLCRDIFEGRIKKGYQQIVKYEDKGSEVILDPDYDPVLLDALFENDLPKLMQDFVSPNVMLFFINAVNSVPPGYMTFWHPDGHVRPVHKIFYYPTWSDDAAPCLQVIPGHVKTAGLSRNRIFSNKYSVGIEATLSKKQMIKSSNDDFVVLNTCTMHRAVPVTKTDGVFRLMYSFIEWFKDNEERRSLMALSGTSIRINDNVVEHYSRRLAQ
jgi:hypothetical protein